MSSGLKEFLLRWVVTTIAVVAACYIVPGIGYDSRTSLVVAALVLGILNAILRPLLLLLALPLLVLTLGLFFFFINGFMLYLVGNLVKGFHVNTFGAAFWGALVISVVSTVLNSVTGSGGARLRVQRGRQPPNRRDDGGGPVIDV